MSREMTRKRVERKDLQSWRKKVKGWNGFRLTVSTTTLTALLFAHLVTTVEAVLVKYAQQGGLHQCLELWRAPLTVELECTHKVVSQEPLLMLVLV
jgi:hypothetical protein